MCSRKSKTTQKVANTLTGNLSSIICLRTFSFSGATGFSSMNTVLYSSGTVARNESSRIKNKAEKIELHILSQISWSQQESFSNHFVLSRTEIKYYNLLTIRVVFPVCTMNYFHFSYT